MNFEKNETHPSKQISISSIQPNKLLEHHQLLPDNSCQRRPDTAPSTQERDPDQVIIMAGLYGSIHDHRGKLACTRRMAMWLTDLPDSTRRPPSVAAPTTGVDEQANEFQSNLGAQPAQGPHQDMAVACPCYQHEDPLRQHPINGTLLPVPLRIPQRRSSINFRHKDSSQSLRKSEPTGPQVASQLAIPHLRVGLPQQTTTTGLHLSYARASTLRLSRGLPRQTARTFPHSDSPHDTITRPQPAVLAPNHTTSIQIVPHRSCITLESRIAHQALNDQILAHFDSSFQNTVHLSGLAMQDTNDREPDQDTAMAVAHAQITSVEIAHTAFMDRQGSQIRQLFGQDTAKEGVSKKHSRSEVSKRFQTKKKKKKKESKKERKTGEGHAQLQVH